jgi:hypothetical protein
MNTEWNAENPPHDGSLIVAVGKVVSTDGCFTDAIPFCAAVQWTSRPGESSGWHLADGLSVARYVGDDVIIHFWMPYPN